MAKRKPKVFLTPHIEAPKILPGQRCVGTVPCKDHFTTPNGDENWKSPNQILPPEARCAYVEPTEEERQAASRKMMLDSTRQRVIDNAQQAIKTMEGFLRTAQQRVNECVQDPARIDFTGELRFLSLPENMLHEFGWGVANASSHIQSAMSAVVDYLRLERGPAS